MKWQLAIAGYMNQNYLLLQFLDIFSEASFMLYLIIYVKNPIYTVNILGMAQTMWTSENFVPMPENLAMSSTTVYESETGNMFCQTFIKMT